MQENIFEIHTGPADSSRLGWERTRSALDSPAQPVEKLFFCSFDHHWITPNAKDLARRMMGLQFLCKPVRPLRDSGNPVDLGNGSPDKAVYPNLPTRVLPELDDMFPEANSSDIPMR